MKEKKVNGRGGVESHQHEVDDIILKRKTTKDPKDLENWMIKIEANIVKMKKRINEIEEEKDQRDMFGMGGYIYEE